MAPIENFYALRHGESQEDVDPNLRDKVSDEEIGLTKKGKEQILLVAKELALEVEEFEGITLVTSTSRRARESTNIILENIGRSDVEVVVEESIRNLNWGGTTSKNVKKNKKQRYKEGVLNYEFPGGDNTPEYINKISSFLKDLVSERNKRPTKECIIVVCHGFSLRIIVKDLTDMTDEDFKWIKNPDNGKIVRLYFDPKTGVVTMPVPLEKRDAE